MTRHCQLNHRNMCIHKHTPSVSLNLQEYSVCTSQIHACVQPNSHSHISLLCAQTTVLAMISHFDQALQLSVSVRLFPHARDALGPGRSPQNIATAQTEIFLLSCSLSTFSSRGRACGAVFIQLHSQPDLRQAVVNLLFASHRGRCCHEGPKGSFFPAHSSLLRWLARAAL